MLKLTEYAVLGVIRSVRPVFRNSADKVAFAVHASFMASGFVLHATGAAALVNRSNLDSSSVDDVGIENWNELEDRYCFIYFFPDLDTNKIVVDILSDNGNLHINALKEHDEQPAQLLIDIVDYIPAGNEDNKSYNFQNLDLLVEELENELIIAYNASSSSSSSPGETPSLECVPRIGSQPSVDINSPVGQSVSHPQQGYCIFFVPSVAGTEPIVIPLPGAGVLYPGPGIVAYSFHSEAGMSGGVPRPGAPAYYPPGVAGYVPRHNVRY